MTNIYLAILRGFLLTSSILIFISFFLNNPISYGFTLTSTMFALISSFMGLTLLNSRYEFGSKFILFTLFGIASFIGLFSQITYKHNYVNGEYSLKFSYLNLILKITKIVFILTFSSQMSLIVPSAIITSINYLLIVIINAITIYMHILLGSFQTDDNSIY